MVWTRFMDMHSGGSEKVRGKEYIYIEAPLQEAISVFYSRFGHNPYRVTCTCCGEDYSVDQEPTLKRATGFERNAHAMDYPKKDGERWGTKPNDPWFDEHYYLDPDEYEEAEKRGYSLSSWTPYGKWISLEDYLKKDSVLVIYAKDIKPEERSKAVPEQGYAWIG